MNKVLLLFLLLLPALNPVLYGTDDESEEAFVVPLSTGIKIEPIYLAGFNGTPEQKEHTTALEKILRFDLNVNGMTQVVAKSPEAESAISRSKYFGPAEMKFWQKNCIGHLIKVTVTDNSVDTEIIDLKGGPIKEIKGIPIDGTLSHDRKQMHLIADSIHKALFGKDGIARSKILYTVREKIPGKNEWISNIVESDYDGANARQIIYDAGYCVTPRYVPPEPEKQAGNFFYVSYKTGQPKIYLGSLKGVPPQRFSYLRGNQLMPVLSFQRDAVAFISDVTGNPDLFIQEFSPEKGAVGKPRQIFTAGLATQGTPTFSPDGNRVAFVSDKDGSPKIYTIKIPEAGKNIKDIHPIAVNKYRRGCTAPAWSPDGTKIAYCAPVDGVRQIFVFDLNTQKEVRLTEGALQKENPSWAHNSLHLVYNAGSDKGSDLYLVNLNKPEPVKISSGKGEKRFPDWEPGSK